MNRPSYDEYEEVESPFAAKSTEKSSSRDRLRTRKNVFNRPFATESTSAPLILETTTASPRSTRKSIGHPDMTDMLEHRSGDLAEAEIDYLEEEQDEEEEVVEKRPAIRSNASAKKNTKTKKNILAKVGWSVVGVLCLRLICMDRGVWDYFATNGDIKERQEELKSIQDENKSLRVEITRIQTDKGYQRQLAKEHLGVIAADEFLILFAGESMDTSESEGPSKL